MRNMSHLQIAIPTSINKGVWGGIMLHAGITGCGLFSQDAFPIIPTPLPMKSPQPLVPVVTLGYLKSLQTNSWQMRWNSTFMKIWTWNRVYHEISMNTKWEGENLFWLLWHHSTAVTAEIDFSDIRRGSWRPTLPAHLYISTSHTMSSTVSGWWEMLSACLSRFLQTLLCPTMLTPIITYFNPIQPWLQSSAGSLYAGFRMSGVSLQSTRGDTGMCTKAVTASYHCQCWRLSFPQKSQLATAGCLILTTTGWHLFPPTFKYLWIEICKKIWRDMWIRDSKTLIIPKVRVWCTWQPTTMLDKSLATAER